MIQSFFTNGQYLGSRTLESWWKQRDGGVYMASNYALYCPVCGDVWARVLVDKPGATWQYHARPCRGCNHNAWAPEMHGAISDPPHWRGSPLTFTDDWPEGAIRWEFQSLIQSFSQEQS